MGVLLNKLKSDRRVYWFLIIFLVSTLSFGVGYVLGMQFNRAPIIIEKITE